MLYKIRKNSLGGQPMKVMCKLFGHKTKEEHQYRHSCYLYCYRCKENVWVAAPKNPKVCQCQWCVKNKINRSDLDESKNVHSHEKWLDKHMD